MAKYTFVSVDIFDNARFVFLIGQEKDEMVGFQLSNVRFVLILKLTEVFKSFKFCQFLLSKYAIVSNSLHKMQNLLP